MKKVPLKELKENLAYWTELANKEGPILITKYNSPYLVLGPVLDERIHIGKYAFGKEKKLKSLFNKKNDTKWKKFLEEDRNEEIS
jgi:hypothetical protein